MDNREIDVTSKGREAFNLAMKLAFDSAPSGRATHYCIDRTQGFTLFWHADKDAIPLPISMDWTACADLVWAWIGQLPREEYKDPFDGDGSSSPEGWRVYTVRGGWSYTFAAIQAVWAWYPK